jgi:hypothetical protein
MAAPYVLYFKRLQAARSAKESRAYEEAPRHEPKQGPGADCRKRPLVSRIVEAILPLRRKVNARILLVNPQHSFR